MTVEPEDVVAALVIAGVSVLAAGVPRRWRAPGVPITARAIQKRDALLSRTSAGGRGVSSARHRTSSGASAPPAEQPPPPPMPDARRPPATRLDTPPAGRLGIPPASPRHPHRPAPPAGRPATDDGLGLDVLLDPADPRLDLATASAPTGGPA